MQRSGLFAIASVGLRGNGVVDQSRQAYAALNGFVMDKVQFRDNAQLQALG
jgi:hypothetical protein